MCSSLDYIHDLYRAYYNSNESFEKLQLRLEIGPIILTGEQILESGIADPSEFDDGRKYTNEEIETLEEEIERVKEERDRLSKQWNDTLDSLEGVSKINDYYRDRIARVEKILNGKKGSFVDELCDALR